MAKNVKALLRCDGIDPKSMIGLPVRVDSLFMKDVAGKVVEAKREGDYVVVTMLMYDPGVAEELLTVLPVGAYSMECKTE